MPTYEAFWSADCTQVSDIGPQLQLALPRKVSDTAQSIEFAMKGNIDGLKNLFSLGLASPRDESHTRGYSLLRWALYGGHLGIHNYEMIQFLVDHGADIDDKSYESVGYWNLRKKYSPANKKALSFIKRQDRKWFNEQKFHPIHKIIFGLSRKLLTDELLQNPNAVFATDATGRTALDWATARTQLDDMRLLIARGSNINSMDITGRTTLHTAVDSHNIEAFQMVLEAGAEPNPQTGLLIVRTIKSTISAHCSPD
ncbi:ankyrin repeat-containing domain protein [Diaporthe sp. PMI_573]|nr:ankyrin repeat-containing domain protein [Diaporthaceae sp. PMI_573]